MPRYLSEIQLKSLEDQGFLLVKNVFSKDEIQSLQSKCSKKCSLVKFNKSVSGDIFEDDDLRTILFKKDIIDLVKDILGENPIYFRDSQLHCKPNERIFHSDNRADYLNPRKTHYPIFRFGVFMQDHKRFSGGIKFRSNSHNRLIFNKLNFKNLLLGNGFHDDPTVYFNTGKIVNAKSELGDIVIWNLRTEHSGGAVILKFLENLSFSPNIDKIIPSFLKLKEHQTRMSIFYAFGRDSQALKDYVEFKKNNINDEEHRKSLSSNVLSLKEKAKDIGIEFLD
tara:strand:+ start:558 stop:1400 length:843 start_codon:yes stop_codon:yes gene_type:complete